MASEKSDLLQGTLDMLVLKIVALEPAHGYLIAQRIQQISREVLQVQQGALYPALHRLEQQGWIEPLPPEERRRPYRITAEGLRTLRARLTTLQQFAQAGLGRLEAL